MAAGGRERCDMQKRNEEEAASGGDRWARASFGAVTASRAATAVEGRKSADERKEGDCEAAGVGGVGVGVCEA